MAYANGRIPVAFLVQAANGAPGQVLEAQTAAQWAAMVAAAAADGVYLRPQDDDGVPSCYRSYDEQVYAAQLAAKGGPTAAPPGTSFHGNGLAIDIVITAQTLAWLNANAGRFGFDNVQGQATRPAENWHWVRTATIANLTNIITRTAEKRDDTMIIISSPNLGQVCITDSAGAFAVDNNVAGVLRQAHPTHDFANDTDVQTEIREAWTRANFVGDALEARIKATINAITITAK